MPAVATNSEPPGSLDPLQAHPYLDLSLADSHPELLRSFHRLFLAIRDGDQAYDAFLERMLHPPGGEHGADANRLTAAYYLNEASRYVEALAALFPRRRRAGLRAHPRVRDTNDLRELLRIVFEGRDPRLAFEARRKLYLAKLFFDVEHCWEVQRGDRHRRYFAELIDRELLVHTAAREDVDIAFDIAADGLRIDYRVGQPLPHEEVWRFRRRELRFRQDGRTVRARIYFYSCRSKREVLPYHYVRGQRVYELETREKWSELSLRRDASIVSKMLRKGVNEPGAFPDIVGAMFIVENSAEVEVLREALFDIVGGPMKIRNVVDTLTRAGDRALLHAQSGAGYKVYKGDLDLLYAEEGDEVPPYGFAVELQLYTLESYLRTIHTRHYASHQRLKRRQFLERLAPLLFPEEIYGRGTRGAAPAVRRGLI